MVQTTDIQKNTSKLWILGQYNKQSSMLLHSTSPAYIVFPEYTFKRIIRGTEMCQEFRHVSVSLVLAVRGSGLPFIRKIDK